MDTVSTKMTNTIPKNVTSTMLTNSDDKKVRHKMNCYILHTVLLVVIPLLITAVVCYHYENSGQNKKTLMHKQYKNGN